MMIVNFGFFSPVNFDRLKAALRHRLKAWFFMLSLKNSPTLAEGMLMITLQEPGLLYMDCIEVAPHNYGANGKYDLVAGCLLAYGCKLSQELGRGPYKGYLSFESKTVLIDLYQEKYGATWAMGQRMYFDPEAGSRLMATYFKNQKKE